MDGMQRDDVATDSATTGGARPRKRDSLFLKATISIGGQEVRDVRVRNLSEGGLMAELDRDVAVGEPVRVTLRGVGDVTGKVAWTTAGRVGVALDRPIDPQRARKPVGAGGGRVTMAAPRR